MIIYSSSISGWPDCQRRTILRPLKKELESLGYEFNSTGYGIPAVVGTSVHKSMEVALSERLPEPDCTDASVQELNRIVREEQPEWDDISPCLTHAEKQVIRMSKVWYYRILPEIEDSEVQTEQRYEGNLRGHKLSGKPDIITEHTIRDLKTGRSVASSIYQLGAYALLVDKTDAKETSVLFIDQLKRTALNRDQEAPTHLKIDPNIAKEESKMILLEMCCKADEFLKVEYPTIFTANPSSNLCKRKYCPAYGTDWCSITKGK